MPAGVEVVAEAVPLSTLRAWLDFDETWGPSEWGPVPVLPRQTFLYDRFIKQWGNAAGGLEPVLGLGTSSAGDSVIAGIRIGNLFVCVQPLLGIEGDPMRLLFERDLTPHAQYIAHYLWLQRSFRADACVHFGMHGTGESRRALHPSCTCVAPALRPTATDVRPPAPSQIESRMAPWEPARIDGPELAGRPPRQHAQRVHLRRCAGPVGRLPRSASAPSPRIDTQPPFPRHSYLHPQRTTRPRASSPRGAASARSCRTTCRRTRAPASTAGCAS